ncbi:hypothetical protein L1987_33313 [Smallanthus sonchifolius]|uniref:Uncharacterized protein n=2 Tax=Smallanthus sonchifolius TaxID=185202 RepID=A0ACB9HQ00_9ASTR|nr:hypothetical protein L1987_33304 [Smallanthus sonchifolius]KAI3798046.1 hypothetical protein L1987_33313 [Smallanthus sonchifolius]
MVRPTTYRRPEPQGSGQHWYRAEDLNIDRRPVNFGGKDMAQKLKRYRCYVRRTKGHAYWNYTTCKTNEGFKQSSMKGKEKEEVKNDAEKKTVVTNKPQLHNQMDTNWIETDYMVQDTDLGDWISYGTLAISFPNT